MRHSVATFVAISIAGIAPCLPVMGATLADNPIISMPAHGDRQRITQMWQRPDGHLAFEFSYRRAGVTFLDFFDTKTGKRLFPARAKEMANSPGGRLSNQLRPQEWKRVETSLWSIAGPEGFAVSRGAFQGGSVCGIQYSSPSTVTQPGVPPFRFTILSKLKTPRVWESECGSGKVALHYEETSFRYLSADKIGFIVLLPGDSAVVRFDWNVKSPFLSGRSDIVVVPYDLLQQELKHEETGAPGRKEYANAEKLIGRYAQQQLQRRP